SASPTRPPPRASAPHRHAPAALRSVGAAAPARRPSAPDTARLDTAHAGTRSAHSPFHPARSPALAPRETGPVPPDAHTPPRWYRRRPAAPPRHWPRRTPLRPRLPHSTPAAPRRSSAGAAPQSALVSPVVRLVRESPASRVWPGAGFAPAPDNPSPAP